MPAFMRLESLGQEKIAPEAKWSICYVHLLYHEADMLLFRRLVSQVTKYSGGDMKSFYRGR